MKKALIVIVALLVGFLVLGVLTDEGGTVSEKIERECNRSYGSQGEQAVLDCRLAMSARYLTDANKRRADDTYNRIK